MSELLEYILSHEEAFRKNRLPSLYSDFAIQKNTNPDGYAVNVAAWEKALIDAARNGRIASSGGFGPGAGLGSTGGDRKRDHLVLSADDNLLRELESPEWGKPVALGSVFDEAIQKRSMVPVQLYKSSSASLSTSRWRVIDPGALSPWSVMNWSLRQLKGFLVGSENAAASPKLQVQKLVLVDNLKEAANRIVKQALSHTSSRLDLIYSKEKFINDFSTVLHAETELSDADFDVLLLYLSRDINAIAYDGKTIKFRSADDTSPITQQDTTIASMKTLIANLSKQIANLEQKINELNAAALAAVNNKNRVSALSALRSKKLAEHNLKQRSDTLSQLEEVYAKIEQAADQVEIVRVMEASTGVLRSLHAQVGGVERVEDVVEELREEMSKVDEIGNIISEAGPVIDETEIDDELEAIEKQQLWEKEEKEAEETRKKLAELDSVEQAAREAARRKLSEAKKKNAEAEEEAELAESIGKLSQMSLEDNAEVASRQGSKEQPLPAK
ncbi:hypothetical protein VTN77DRAFT_8308 [Rasamsonia byssochlamydoides]|uniref:uncharacterized protein n=1 Tax=Rasamsonia byssochlamydoides TaxID=89139 RepID=UPI0037438393